MRTITPDQLEEVAAVGEGYPIIDRPEEAPTFGGETATILFSHFDATAVHPPKPAQNPKPGMSRLTTRKTPCRRVLMIGNLAPSKV